MSRLDMLLAPYTNGGRVHRDVLAREQLRAHIGTHTGARRPKAR